MKIPIKSGIPGIPRRQGSTRSEQLQSATS